MEYQEIIIFLVSMILTWLLGIISKKSTWLNNHLIPTQNLVIGLVVAIIDWIITKDFSTAIALSGLMAGGTYDIIHNFNKMLDKEEEEDEENIQTEFNEDELPFGEEN